MKPLLLFLIIYNLHGIVHSYDDEKDSMLFKTYPKKVHQNQMYNAKLINSARIIKTAPPYMKPMKRGRMDAGYTVFPKVSTLVPDSPYFPLEFDFLHKNREKKMLHRRKRAAPDTHSPAPAKVSKATTKPANKPAEVKPKASKPKANSPKATKPKPAVAAKKGALKQGNKPAPNLTKAASHAAKDAKPTSKVAKKAKAKLRRGVLRNKKQAGQTNKGSRPRKIGRKWMAKKRSLRNGTKAKVTKPGQKGKRRIRRKRRGSRKSPIKGAKPGVPHKVPGRRLIAARDGAPEIYPYMISIQKDDEHWCSGALLNRRLIISTANCFWKSRSISRLKIRAGSRHPDQGGQVAYIQEVMKHPWWSIRSGPDNDIALGMLDRTLKFSHDVHGVDLPNRAMMPPFDDFWVTSFGSERRDGVYERHGKRLQAFHTRLMDHGKCNNITQRFGIAVTENFICLHQYGRRAPCTRDTGAPAVSDGILWGLASWGLRKLCGTERYPSMFSYVGSETNMDFIINATRYLMSENRENPMLDRLPKRLNYQTNPDYPLQPGETTLFTRKQRRTGHFKEGDVVF